MREQINSPTAQNAVGHRVRSADFPLSPEAAFQTREGIQKMQLLKAWQDLRMSEKSTPTYAPRDRIDAFENLANEFVREILGLPWALMTDESALSDFSGCGLDVRDDLERLDDEAHRALWDKWVVERVCEHYRIESFPVTIRMVQLFERIERAAPLQ